MSKKVRTVPAILTDDPATDSLPVWSPDGTAIAFSSDREGGADLYVMEADGTGVTRLTDAEGTDTQPSWN